MGKNKVTGRQIAAARSLTGVSHDVLAARAGISVTTLRRMEASEGEAPGVADKVAAVRRALEDFGAVFIPENGGGAGVRLKFTRSDAKQIGRLEGEGGIVRDDDVT